MKTLIIVMFIILSTAALADNVSIEISTSQDIDSVIIENAEGDISTDIYCNGNTCNTNIYGGNVDVPQNQTFIYNKFVKSSHVGLDISEIVYNLGSKVNDFNSDLIEFGQNSWYDLIIVLDKVFVSHREFQATYENTLYLAEEIDRLKAENAILRENFGVGIESWELECRTAVFKSQRYNHQIITKSGYIADFAEFGNECVKID